MVHGDPERRTAQLAAVTEILKHDAPAEDRELLLSLAPILFAGMPPQLALELAPAAVAAGLLFHLRFVVREMPPAHQLYKGLPGIHVSVVNPSEGGFFLTGGNTK